MQVKFEQGVQQHFYARFIGLFKGLFQFIYWIFVLIIDKLTVHWVDNSVPSKILALVL